MKQPPFPQKEDLVSGWIDFHKAEQNSVEYEESFWSFMLMEDLVEDFPYDALEVILLIVDRDQSDSTMGSVAAGPIEDLLTKHGPKVIDRIEREARRNKHFNHALGGVWQSSSLSEVWSRVEAVRHTVW